MSRYEQLTKRLERLLTAVERRREPLTWHTCLEEGEALSEALQAHIGPDDTLVVTYYPANYFGEDRQKCQSISRWEDKHPIVIEAEC